MFRRRLTPEQALRRAHRAAYRTSFSRLQRMHQDDVPRLLFPRWHTVAAAAGPTSHRTILRHHSGLWGSCAVAPPQYVHVASLFVPWARADGGGRHLLLQDTAMRAVVAEDAEGLLTRLRDDRALAQIRLLLTVADPDVDGLRTLVGLGGFDGLGAQIEEARAADLDTQVAARVERRITSWLDTTIEPGVHPGGCGCVHCADNTSGRRLVAWGLANTAVEERLEGHRAKWRNAGLTELDTVQLAVIDTVVAEATTVALTRFQAYPPDFLRGLLDSARGRG